jgi:hypothetical protein
MLGAGMKKYVGTVSAVPSKRVYQSIIADYDLNKSICELIDNGLDVWARGGRNGTVLIKVILNEDQKTICVEDNAGGVAENALSVIVGPGQTGSSKGDEIIGFFGVGTKRAMVALAQDIRVTTRFGKEATFRIEFDDPWIDDESTWDVPYYEVDPVSEGTTKVELHKLRVTLNDDVIEALQLHLGATYATFLASGQVEIRVNNDPVQPEFFDNWAYPPNYLPHRYRGEIPADDGTTVKVEVLAGLSDESSPASGEYGVYFYGNDRLFARGLKNYDVGFTKGLAGLPHPKVSLTKVIVSLHGDSGDMPWNSSKSDISANHPTFVALQVWLVTVVKDFAGVSRAYQGEWPDRVFRFKTGKIVDVAIDDFPTAKKSYLAPAPKSRPRYGEVVTQSNSKLAKQKPWVRGLYEGVIAADLISKQKLDQKNRIVLILLDSTLEIAFKEYLVNDSGQHYSDAQLLNLFKQRHLVQAEVKKFVNIPAVTWKKIGHYYNIRCDLVHKRASAGISDKDVKEFREVIEAVLKKLYKLKFEKA